MRCAAPRRTRTGQDGRGRRVRVKRQRLERGDLAVVFVHVTPPWGPGRVHRRLAGRGGRGRGFCWALAMIARTRIDGT